MSKQWRAVRRPRARLYRTLAVGIVLMVGVAGCGSSTGADSASSGSKLPVVRILSYNSGLGNVLSLAMQENHFDTKNGFTGKFVRVDSSAATQDFLQGAADVTLQEGFLEAAIARNKGQDITIFWPDLTNNGTVTVAKDSSITSPADIKGKKVGQTGLGSGTTSGIRYIYAEKYGIDLTKDASLVTAGPPALVQLLQQNQIQAMIDFTPYTEQAMVQNGARELLRADDPANGNTLGLGFGALAAKESWIKAHAELAYEVQDALKDTVNFFISQKYAPFKQTPYSTALGVSSAVIDKVVSRAQSEPLMTNTWNTTVVEQTRQFFASVAKQGVLISKAPDPQVVDTLQDLVGPRK